MPEDSKFPIVVSPMTNGVNGFRRIGADGLSEWPNA
jgi:hypothetical protein